MVLVDKTIMCRLDITSVDDQFCPDYKKMRYDLLKSQFVGYCNRGILITEIVEILQSSQIRTNSKVLNGYMHVDLMAKVRGIIYEPGEIIADAKIIKVENNLITAYSNFTRINVVLGSTPNVLKAGDVTPIIVKLARYNINTPQIQISGELFAPKPQSNIPMYTCADKYKTDDDIDQMHAIVDNYINYFKTLDNEKKKSKEFFMDLLSSPKLASKINGVSMKKSNLIKFSPPQDRYIIMYPGNLADDSIYVGESVAKKTHIVNESDQIFVPVAAKAQNIMRSCLGEYIKNLYTLMQLVETYPDTTTIQKSQHVWNFYKLMKAKK